MPVEETYVFANNRAGVGKSTSAFELVSSYARRKHTEGVKYVTSVSGTLVSTVRCALHPHLLPKDWGSAPISETGERAIRVARKAQCTVPAAMCRATLNCTIALVACVHERDSDS